MEYLVKYNLDNEGMAKVKHRHPTLKFLINVHCDSSFKCINDLQKDPYLKFFNPKNIIQLLYPFYYNELVIMDVESINYSNYDSFVGIRIKTQLQEYYYYRVEIKILIDEVNHIVATNIIFNDDIKYQEFEIKNGKYIYDKKVVNNFALFGLLKAQKIKEICARCKYFNRYEMIECAVHPSSVLETTTECKDFEFNQSLLIVES